MPSAVRPVLLSAALLAGLWSCAQYAPDPETRASSAADDATRDTSSDAR